MTGEIREIAAKRLKKLSSGPKISDGRKITALGEGRQHTLLAFAFRTRIDRSGEPPRADSRHMHERSHAARPRRLRDPLRGFRVDRTELLPPARLQNTNQVHRPIHAAQRIGDRAVIAHIRLNQRDLARLAERQKMHRQIRTAHRDLDPASCPRQGLHHIAAQKARTAENRDYGRISQCDRHGGLICVRLSRIRLVSNAYPGFARIESRRCRSPPEFLFLAAQNRRASIDKGRERLYLCANLPRWRNW